MPCGFPQAKTGDSHSATQSLLVIGFVMRYLCNSRFEHAMSTACLACPS